MTARRYNTQKLRHPQERCMRYNALRTVWTMDETMLYSKVRENTIGLKLCSSVFHISVQVQLGFSDSMSMI